ncbi:DUF2279 domain-containing protein [Lishizhenia sp.]|uniref:DUF2279 domain-containing protein n=1 Tax=Lishizhenia sp. TaxID=2497594 RepID=UPI00299D3781|nr:DUF2279 domain-containing protein [Lishizhenia sp.]MDX1445080.1 DUF2279 domain-containing protein [Lishizhenia sp.]
MVKNLCKTILLFFCLSQGLIATAQPLQKDKTKKLVAHSSLLGLCVSTPIVLQSVWYDKAASFHIVNDGDSWLGMDKTGHAFSAYHIQKQAQHLYIWANYSHNKSILYSAGISILFQSSFEVLDGFQKKYGFSWPDMYANVSGIALFSAQQFLWKEERIRLKFSYSPSPYAKLRPEVLGQNFQERLLKDYNGQSYWLSFSPFQLFNSSLHFPKWIQLSLGYSVNEKVKGSENYFSTTTQEYHAYSQFLFSLDFDFSQMNIRNKSLKKVLSIFNTLKIPFPALSFSQNQIHFHPLYF